MKRFCLVNSITDESGRDCDDNDYQYEARIYYHERVAASLVSIT